MRDTPKELNLQETAKRLATEAGFDPNERISKDEGKTWPRWCSYLPQANAEIHALKAHALEAPQSAPQAVCYQNAPLFVFGMHDAATLQQMNNCMEHGSVLGGALCADGHLAYSQPVGGVIAYDNGDVSVSGVGVDIACGNMAIRLDTTFGDICDRLPLIMNDISKHISFGIGRVNDEKAEHRLFDDNTLWAMADMEEQRSKALKQLGTVGSGNHYVDVFVETTHLDNPEFGGSSYDCPIWIGVHFGSRGLGHATCQKYLKLAGGKDGVHAPPTILNFMDEIGMRYWAAMQLSGDYAYAGREWVVERVRSIVGGKVTKTVHNHHNYAWREAHNGGFATVVRKGATPAFPGQEGFVGGSMGDDAVILEGVDSDLARQSFYSTVHGAGRTFGRNEAKRTLSRAQWNKWMKNQCVLLKGGDLDESPMAYRRLGDVLAAHQDTIKINHVLKPLIVVMAGTDEFDPYKD